MGLTLEIMVFLPLYLLKLGTDSISLVSGILLLLLSLENSLFSSMKARPNVTLVQFVECGNDLDYLWFTVLLANLDEFFFRGRQKHNYTKVNEVLIGYEFKKKWKMVSSMLF